MRVLTNQRKDRFMAKAYLTPIGWRKTCCTCKQEFTLDFFFKSKQTPDGLFRRCKSCSKAATKAVEERRKTVGLGRLNTDTEVKRKERRRSVYASNPEKYRARSRINGQRFKEKNRAYTTKYRERNREAVRAYARAYYHENKESIGPRSREQVMRRYATKGKATPPWSDREAILVIYRRAVELTAETGIEHQVDHIIPILSKLVCGLHVHANMQILKKSENIRKGNRMWPGHPDPKRDMLLVAEAEQGIYLPSKRRDAIDAVSF